MVTAPGWSFTLGWIPDDSGRFWRFSFQLQFDDNSLLWFPPPYKDKERYDPLHFARLFRIIIELIKRPHHQRLGLGQTTETDRQMTKCLLDWDIRFRFPPCCSILIGCLIQFIQFRRFISVPQVVPIKVVHVADPLLFYQNIKWNKNKCRSSTAHSFINNNINIFIANSLQSSTIPMCRESQFKFVTRPIICLAASNVQVSISRWEVGYRHFLFSSTSCGISCHSLYNFQVNPGNKWRPLFTVIKSSELIKLFSLISCCGTNHKFQPPVTFSTFDPWSRQTFYSHAMLYQFSLLSI